MTHRERFMAVMNGQKPDRIPIVGNMTVQEAEKFSQMWGLDVDFVDSWIGTRISHREILNKLGNDAVIIAATRGTPTRTLPNGDVEDEWHMVYHRVGLYDEIVKRPLSECETVEDLNAYQFPDALAPQRWAFAEEIIPRYKNEYGIIGDLEAAIFEIAWNMVGMEKFLTDLICDEEYIDPFLDRLEDFATKCGVKMVELGCDMIWCGDDFGTQNGMMISPDLFREKFKFRYERMWRKFKEINPNVKIAHHTCGSVIPIIPDFIEIGLDFLNPIQPQAKGMNLAELYAQYGDRLGFFGGVDIQGVLPHGSLEDVRNEVHRVMDAVRHGNNFIIGPAHNIQADTPVENVIAFYEESIKYGVIPG